jgi:pimeloyl-ACP methyl ester carboxylesterase
MSSRRTHDVTTTDGVTIGETVHGRGRPLVFLQGIIGDGELDWRALLPHLTNRYTCHLPSMRGRGLSGDHPDLGLGRVVADFLIYVKSIGKPIRAGGLIGGATLALAMAARSGAADAVATVEPVANSLMDEQEAGAAGVTGTGDFRDGLIDRENVWIVVLSAAVTV